MNYSELLRMIDVIATEKKIDRAIIIEALELALASAYKKHSNLPNVRVKVDDQTGEFHIYSFKTVVEEVTNENLEISLEDAKKQVPNIELEETIEKEVDSSDFGRVAAGTAKQVVIQKIKEAEKLSIMEEFKDKQDELMVGIVSREDERNYYIDLGRAHGVLPKSEIIPGEKIEMGSSIKVYVTKLDLNPKGPLILLSRAHYGYLKRLLELEIPEITDGIVILYSVAREAGSRSKIAVYSENNNVDPIGACIGERGSRIARIINELNGEKIDIVEYNKDAQIFIQNALSPAKNVSVFITDLKKQEALAVVDEENLSLAIGKKGQNVKLAARLTRYKIDVKSVSQAKEEGLIVNE